MGTVIKFPNQRFGERLEPLRHFLDEAEAGEKDRLDEAHLDELEVALDHVWPGVVAIEPTWITKFAFAFAGVAIGFGLHP